MPALLRSKFGLAILALLCCLGSTRAADPDLRTLSHEVTALQALHDLELSKDQLQELAKIADGAAGTPKTAKHGNAQSPAYRAALVQLQEALIKGKGDKISEARFKLDEVARRERREPEEAVEPTDLAKQMVPRVLRLLTVSQVGNFIGSLDLVDPLQRLLEGADEINGLTGDEKNALRDDVAQEVGQLLGGFGAPGKRVTDRIAKFLDKVAATKDFEKKKPDLEKEARQIVGEPDALKVLQHSIEQSLAELLANPRLPAAIIALSKK
jgi:hypothetical protein